MAAANAITGAMVEAAYGATAARTKPRDGDAFRKGDYVVYPAHGVGKVERVGVEEIAGHKLNLIQISFDGNQMTLRVPVAQARAAGLRKLASPKAMDEAVAILHGRPRVSRLMWAKRAQEYLAKVNSGDLKVLAEVVRDLQMAEDGSGSSFSQRNLYELAIDRLAAEFAAVFATDKAAALAKLALAMQNGRTAQAHRSDTPSIAAQA